MVISSKKPPICPRTQVPGPLPWGPCAYPHPVCLSDSSGDVNSLRTETMDNCVPGKMCNYHFQKAQTSRLGRPPCSLDSECYSSKTPCGSLISLSSQKHTPGPWGLKTDRRRQNCVLSSPGSESLWAFLKQNQLASFQKAETTKGRRKHWSPWHGSLFWQPQVSRRF